MNLLKKWQEQTQVVVEAKDQKSLKDPTCVLIIAQSTKNLQGLAKDHLYDWQLKSLKDTKDGQKFFQNEKYQVATFVLEQFKYNEKDFSQLKDNLRVTVRNQVGQLSGACNKVEFILDDQIEGIEDVIAGVVEACTLGSYSYKNTKSSKITFFMDKKYLQIAKEAWQVADATNFARYLVDSPPNYLGPKNYINLAKDLVKGQKNFKIEVKSKELEEEGYGLIHAVGKGSSEAPAIVKVSYQGSEKAKKIALVGKGITFDTGGLDLKPPQYMRNMKKDMGGSAAVAALLYYHLQNPPKQNVDYYLAIAENSVNSNAFRPGDICTAGNGLSVEIHNTDAEGRLALADALSWVSKDKKAPDLVIDVATLTGAIKAGLGSYVGGLFSNDKELCDQIYLAAEKSGDYFWPMPLPHWTEADIKNSQVADLVNACDGYGGAITAAQFLRKFIPKNSKWAHLDIYAWVDSQRGPLKQKGGSGQGVMALIDFLKN